MKYTIYCVYYVSQVYFDTGGTGGLDIINNRKLIVDDATKTMIVSICNKDDDRKYLQQRR